jgi:hypothetical protein
MRLWGPGNPKEQFLGQLLVRVGHEGLLNFKDPFVFDADGERWRNIDQLEAVVEFYLNFPEPWGGGEPRKPGHEGYVTVNLRDPEGEAASTGTGAVVTLDGDPDLTGVIPNPVKNPAAGAAAGGVSPPNYPARLKYLYDTLWLESDTARPSRTYLIVAVDNAAKTVTLDAAPNCPDNTSRWRLNKRPTIVIIDPLGARVRSGITLSGTRATVAGTDPHDKTRTILSLDNTIALDRINAGFDSIHLDTDKERTAARPGPAYRIAAVDPPAHTVTVVGAPSLHGHVSAWQIPAGLGGVSPDLKYDLGPQYSHHSADELSRGYDHYDAALFLVYRGRVEGQRFYRWSSYTSRVYGTWSAAEHKEFKDWQQQLSSVGGNARYFYSAYYSSKDDFKNFTFAVVDATPDRTFDQHVASDSIAVAKFYYGTPSPPAPPIPPVPNNNALNPGVWADNDATHRPGKGSIRLHRGSLGRRFGTGSAGCIVSPDYVYMRTDLLKLFEQDYAEFYGPGTYDADVRQITNADDYDKSAALYDAKVKDANGNDTDVPLFPASGWTGKVVGNLWLIRPDERPVDGP